MAKTDNNNVTAINPPLHHCWKEISNLKQLATLGEELSNINLPHHISRECVTSALFDVMRKEAEHIESATSKRRKSHFDSLD